MHHDGAPARAARIRAALDDESTRLDLMRRKTALESQRKPRTSPIARLAALLGIARTSHTDALPTTSADDPPGRLATAPARLSMPDPELARVLAAENEMVDAKAPRFANVAPWRAVRSSGLLLVAVCGVWYPAVAAAAAPPPTVMIALAVTECRLGGHAHCRPVPPQCKAVVRPREHSASLYCRTRNQTWYMRRTPTGWSTSVATEVALG